jgi:hypothetical protein
MRCMPIKWMKTYEVYPYEMHAHEMHAREVHAHETHAYKIHARKVLGKIFRSPTLQTVVRCRDLSYVVG